MTLLHKYWKTASLAATGQLGDSPLFPLAYLLRFLRVAVLLALWRTILTGKGTVSGMTLGWPAAEPFIRPRLPLRAILHWQRYDAAGEEEALAQYDRAMVDTGIYKGRQVAVPGVEGEVEDYGWLEHSARRVSQPLRAGLRQVLDSQGFTLK